MTIKPWSTIGPWPFKLYSLWSWSFCCLTEGKIEASWWHVRKIMISFLSRAWTSHEVPILNRDFVAGSSSAQEAGKCVSFTHRSRCQQRPRLYRCWSNTPIRRSSSGACWSCQISGGVGCQQRPRHDRYRRNASFHSSSEGASWSCPMSGWIGRQ